MTKINIPNKTFNFYKEGIRTFIHIPKNEDNSFVKNLKFGEKVLLVNIETNEEFEQTFWFLYEFDKIPRFYILLFSWDTKDELFFLRRKCAIQIRQFKIPTRTLNYSLSVYGDKDSLRCALIPLSGLLFVGDVGSHASDGDLFIIQNVHEEILGRYYVTNVLGLKVQDREDGKIVYVMSLFPEHFLSLI